MFAPLFSLVSDDCHGHRATRHVKANPFTEEQVCGQRFLRDFAAACRKMSPLVKFMAGNSDVNFESVYFDL
jgi:hypothetical protein